MPPPQFPARVGDPRQVFQGAAHANSEKMRRLMIALTLCAAVPATTPATAMDKSKWWTGQETALTDTVQACWNERVAQKLDELKFDMPSRATLKNLEGKEYLAALLKSGAINQKAIDTLFDLGLCMKLDKGMRVTFMGVQEDPSFVKLLMDGHWWYAPISPGFD
ncbi:MAG TPA: hypothetical protein VKG78_11605 [Opitutaceae bacterium]|nr:hypothetical protein [Opitutaceae bacterium]